MANGGIDPVYTDTSESTVRSDFSRYRQIGQYIAPSNREPVYEWQGERKLFVKRIVAESTPERYLANLSSRVLGWIDRDSQWMCEVGELLSFSQGNGEQEALVVLPPYGWIRTANGSLSLQPEHERPWMAQFHRI